MNIEVELPERINEDDFVYEFSEVAPTYVDPHNEYSVASLVRKFLPRGVKGDVVRRKNGVIEVPVEPEELAKFDRKWFPIVLKTGTTITVVATGREEFKKVWAHEK